MRAGHDLQPRCRVVLGAHLFTEQWHPDHAGGRIRLHLRVRVRHGVPPARRATRPQRSNGQGSWPDLDPVPPDTCAHAAVRRRAVPDRHAESGWTCAGPADLRVGRARDAPHDLPRRRHHDVHVPDRRRLAGALVLGTRQAGLAIERLVCALAGIPARSAMGQRSALDDRRQRSVPHRGLAAAVHFRHDAGLPPGSIHAVVLLAQSLSRDLWSRGNRLCATGLPGRRPDAAASLGRSAVTEAGGGPRKAARLPVRLPVRAPAGDLPVATAAAWARLAAAAARPEFVVRVCSASRAHCRDVAAHPGPGELGSVEHGHPARHGAGRLVSDQEALPLQDHPSVMRLVLLAAMLVLVGCNVRMAAPGSTPAPPAATDCLSLGSDSGGSLPPAADIAALTGGAVPPAASAPAAVPNYFLHVPPNAPSDRPIQVLLALHGFGGQGQDFAQQFVSVADANQWIVVAATLNYTSLTDAAATRADDLRITQDLMAILTDVPQRSGLAVRDRVLLVGFSRGGSMAERFALLHPELVQAV